MFDDNKNLLVAIVLSVVVLIGWNYFYGAPQMKQQREAAQTQVMPPKPGETAPAQTNPAQPTPGAPNAAAPATASQGAAAPAAVTREAALERSPRVRIDTPTKAGSIALRGGRIDDLALKNYHETVDPQSPNIVLLSPSGGPMPYYAEFGWVGDVPGGVPGSDTLWTADSQVLTPDHPVTLTFDNGQGLVFHRQIAVDPKSMFTIRDTVENHTGAPVTLYPYGLVSRHGQPETLGYYVLHEGLIGVLGNEGLQEYTYKNIEKESPLGGQAGTKGKVWKNVTGGFVGITDKYWATAVVPDQSASYQGGFTVRQEPQGPVFQSNVLGDARTVAPGATAEATKHLFAGAKEVSTVNHYEEALGIKRFDLLIDWGWFYFITKPLFWVLDTLYKLIGNFGVAILIVTVMLKILFFPLANKSYRSMAKMKAVQPEMQAIRERYADDKVKQQQALMELYKKEKINPVAGCWPVVIQIPVFYALYKVLFVTIEMRHAPFFGWIRDLASPDPTSIFNLFGLLPFAPPDALHLGIWPIIMGITMFVQMKMNPAPPDPVQKTMFTWMPVVFTFMLARFPAGLVIYWAWNNTLSVTQQYFIMRQNGVKVELWDNLRDTFNRKAAAKG